MSQQSERFDSGLGPGDATRPGEAPPSMTPPSAASPVAAAGSASAAPSGAAAGSASATPAAATAGDAGQELFRQAYKNYFLAPGMTAFNYPEAQHNLGYNYDHGLGVPQDLAEALSWYQRAADQGYPAAKIDLDRLR